MAEKILVVDDERPIADILQFNLEREGFQVVLAHSGEEALEVFRREQPHLILLDIMLPKGDGFSVCKELRKVSTVPILMLTAKESEIDKVLGLELGADDYVTKPFSPRELIARVKALLRRARPVAGKAAAAGTAPNKTGGDLLQLGELTIDLERYLVERGGERIDLTPREFDLLKFLALHPGQVFSREALCREVWGYDYFGDARTVDVTVRRLREKIEPDPSQPRYLLTRRGVGYYVRS